MSPSPLFGPVVPMSATKLDLVNSCHFGYFLRFGLDAKPRHPPGHRQRRPLHPLEENAKPGGLPLQIRRFDFADVADGRGLQMLLYLFALRREGKGLLGPEETVPAGVLYAAPRRRRAARR